MKTKIATDRFTFFVHDSFQFLKVSQLDLQLFHLSLNQQSNQALDLPFFNGCQMLQSNNICM